MPVPRLFLLDANALCYRSFYAIRGLMTSTGQPTNAVYGFTNTLRKIIKDFSPDYMGVCFDVGKKTHRTEKYAQYKVQRPPMPEDLVGQIRSIKDVVEAYNLPILEREGYEADDLIATAVDEFKDQGVEIIIVSDDKDMYQLLGKNVKVYSVRKDALMDEKDVEEKLGFAPRLIPDFIALAGDKSDNIPGVRGVGEVSAKKMLAQYGDLDSILAADDIQPEKLRDKLVEQKDMAVLSKELALLSHRVDLKVGLDDLKVGAPNYAALQDLYHSFEFRRLADECAKGLSAQKTVSSTPVQSAKEGQDLVARIFGIDRMAFLLLSDGQESLYGDEVMVGLGSEDIFRVSQDVFAQAVAACQEQGKALVTFDFKQQLKCLGDVLQDQLIFDIKLAGYLISPNRAGFELASLAWEYLQMTVPEKDGGAAVVAAIHGLAPRLLKELEKRDLKNLYEEIEVPLAYVIHRMETEGVKLDLKVLNEMSKECEKKLNTLMKEIYHLAGEEFNINSPKQLSVILFEKLELPALKRTKTGFSTNEEVLTRLADEHALPAKILEYRQLNKLVSTYIDALPKLVDPRTHKLHASFHQTGTETGRLSSSHPNLQNIPIRTELGRQIRKAFVPSKKNHVIVSADYSQIELRVLAHLSEDPGLIQAFEKEEDIHQITAARIFDVDEQDVTREMRYSAKRVNFGIIYGMSAFGLAKDLGVSQPEAQAFIDRYFLRYPNVRHFMDEQIAFCERNSYVLTLLNRRRYIPEILSKNVNLRQFAQRQAINTPVQGSAADLIKLAMIQIQDAMDELKLLSRMIITVHDELVFEVPLKERGELIKLVRDKMEAAFQLRVPVKVAVKLGENWLETKEIALS